MNDLLRDGVKETRHSHKVKLRRATPGPATNLYIVLCNADEA